MAVNASSTEILHIHVYDSVCMCSILSVRMYSLYVLTYVCSLIAGMHVYYVYVHSQ